MGRHGMEPHITEDARSAPHSRPGASGAEAPLAPAKRQQREGVGRSGRMASWWGTPYRGGMEMPLKEPILLGYVENNLQPKTL